MLASALRRRVLSPLGARLLGTRWIHAGRVSSSASASPDAAPTADDADPAGKLASDLATYARQKYRSGDRDAAAGVLEHGADMVLRVGSGPAVDAAASRARLAWALMQAVRTRLTFPGITSPDRRVREKATTHHGCFQQTHHPPSLPTIPPHAGCRRARARVGHPHRRVYIRGRIGRIHGPRRVTRRSSAWRRKGACRLPILIIAPRRGARHGRPPRRISRTVPRWRTRSSSARSGPR